MTAETRLRSLLAAVGALAGLAYYLLLEEAVLTGAAIPLQRLIIYTAIAAFPAFGLMAGPLPAPRAGLLAAGLALVTGSLATLAGFRFDAELSGLGDLLEPTGEGLIIGPFLALAAFSIPVLTSLGQGRAGWSDYHRILPLAWTAALKSIIAGLFLGLFWAVYFLCNTLLELVGIDILEELVDWDPGPFLISGAVAGVALAVTCELETIVQTVMSLFLRLLRLLLLPVTLVLALFVLATLVQGVGEVFANNSAAATMMLMAGGSVILIAAALNFHDEEARTHPVVLASLRVMSVVLPVVAGIAIYAIWLRVEDHGWTPPRLLAVLSAGIIVLFVLPVSAQALLARPGWQGRTLSGFVWALLASLCLGALWFTPLLNAQKISAQAQLERLLDGRVDLDDYNFWPLARDWGPAGREALAAYEASGPVPEDVARRIASARTADHAWQAARTGRQITAEQRWTEEMSRIQRVPGSGPLPTAEDFAEHALERAFLQGFLDDCQAPELSRCVALQGDFLTGIEGPEWLFLSQARFGGRINTRLFAKTSADGWEWAESNLSTSSPPDLDAIAAVLAGEFEIVQPRIQGLQIGGARLMPQNER